MIVLLHFFHLGYSPFILALLFLLYEFVGIFSNLTGGWLTSKFGIKKIILFGFSLQIIGILSLSFVDNTWNLFLSLIWIIVFQGICGIVFAINSSLHSYLILAFSSSSKTSEDIGFYYTANAVGRFFGTLLSGLLYQFGSIELCLFGTFIFLVFCLSFTMYLPNKLYTHLQS